MAANAFVASLKIGLAPIVTIGKEFSRGLHSTIFPGAVIREIPRKFTRPVG